MINKNELIIINSINLDYILNINNEFAKLKNRDYNFYNFNIN